MTTTYAVFNQLTGQQETALTYADILIKQATVKQEFYASLDNIFTITALVDNEDGTVTQCAIDENGNPIINSTDPV